MIAWIHMRGIPDFEYAFLNKIQLRHCKNETICNIKCYILNVKSYLGWYKTRIQQEALLDHTVKDVLKERDRLSNIYSVINKDNKGALTWRKVFCTKLVFITILWKWQAAAWALTCDNDKAHKRH